MIGGEHYTHRMRRHHKEGVEEVRRRFGDDAARAAELHIADDWGFVPEALGTTKADTPRERDRFAAGLLKITSSGFDLDRGDEVLELYELGGAGLG